MKIFETPRGSMFQAARNWLRLSIEEVVEAAEISRSGYHNIEAERSMARRKTNSRLVAFFRDKGLTFHTSTNTDSNHHAIARDLPEGASLEVIESDALRSVVSAMTRLRGENPLHMSTQDIRKIQEDLFFANYLYTEIRGVQIQRVIQEMDIRKSVGIFGQPSFVVEKELYQLLLRLGFPKTVELEGDSIHTVSHQNAENLRNLIEFGRALKPLVDKAEYSIIVRSRETDASFSEL